MSEWIRIRVKDFYKDAVGEREYTYVTSTNVIPASLW